MFIPHGCHAGLHLVPQALQSFFAEEAQSKMAPVGGVEGAGHLRGEIDIESSLAFGSAVSAVDHFTSRIMELQVPIIWM